MARVAEANVEALDKQIRAVSHPFARFVAEVAGSDTLRAAFTRKSIPSCSPG